MRTPGTSEAETPRFKKRVHSVDVARGLAIVFVFVGHGLILLADDVPGSVIRTLDRATTVVIPLFMGISGLTMAYLLRRSGRSPASVQRRYARRALELLVTTHLLITIGIYPVYWNEHSFLEVLLLRWHITDAIAICVLVGPVLIYRLSDRARVVAALALLVICRFVTSFWHPAILPVAAVKEFLCGIHDYDPMPVLLNSYALGPHLAMFLMGTALAASFFRAVDERRLPRFLKHLCMAGVALMIVGACLVAFYYGLRSVLDRRLHADWLGFFFPSKNLVLLPIYTAGAAAVLAFFIWRIELQGRYGGLEFLMTIFGRTSLFAYVAQYPLIQGLPAYLGWTHSLSIGVYVLVLIPFTLFMALVSYAYARKRGLIGPGEFEFISRGVATNDHPAVAGAVETGT